MHINAIHKQDASTSNSTPVHNKINNHDTPPANNTKVPFQGNTKGLTNKSPLARLEKPGLPVSGTDTAPDWTGTTESD